MSLSILRVGNPLLLLIVLGNTHINSFKVYPPLGTQTTASNFHLGKNTIDAVSVSVFKQKTDGLVS